MHLDLGFQRFFRRQGGFPKFKNKHGRQSISYPQGVKVKGKTLYLPKVGNVKARASFLNIESIKRFDEAAKF